MTSKGSGEGFISLLPIESEGSGWDEVGISLHKGGSHSVPWMYFGLAKAPNSTIDCSK